MSDVTFTPPKPSVLTELPAYIKRLEDELASLNARMDALTSEAQSVDQERREIIAAIARLTGKSTSTERSAPRVATTGVRRGGRPKGSKNRPKLQVAPSNGPTGWSHAETASDDREWETPAPAAE